MKTKRTLKDRLISGLLALTMVASFLPGGLITPAVALNGTGGTANKTTMNEIAWEQDGDEWSYTVTVVNPDLTVGNDFTGSQRFFGLMVDAKQDVAGKVIPSSSTDFLTATATGDIDTVVSKAGLPEGTYWVDKNAKTTLEGHKIEYKGTIKYSNVLKAFTDSGSPYVTSGGETIGASTTTLPIVALFYSSYDNARIGQTSEFSKPPTPTVDVDFTDFSWQGTSFPAGFNPGADGSATISLTGTATAKFKSIEFLSLTKGDGTSYSGASVALYSGSDVVGVNEPITAGDVVKIQLNAGSNTTTSSIAPVTGLVKLTYLDGTEEKSVTRSVSIRANVVTVTFTTGDIYVNTTTNTITSATLPVMHVMKGRNAITSESYNDNEGPVAAQNSDYTGNDTESTHLIKMTSPAPSSSLTIAQNTSLGGTPLYDDTEIEVEYPDNNIYNLTGDTTVTIPFTYVYKTPALTTSNKKTVNVYINVHVTNDNPPFTGTITIRKDGSNYTGYSGGVPNVYFGGATNATAGANAYTYTYTAPDNTKTYTVRIGTNVAKTSAGVNVTVNKDNPNAVIDFYTITAAAGTGAATATVNGNSTAVVMSGRTAALAATADTGYDDATLTWTTSPSDSASTQTGGTVTVYGTATFTASYDAETPSTGSASITVNKDGSPWTTGATVQLRPESGDPVALTGGTGGVYTNTAVPPATYSIYVNGIDSNVDVTVSAGAEATGTVNYYTVSFDANDVVSNPSSQIVPSGGKATAPSVTTPTGYTLAGWYTDDGTFANGWDFGTNTVSAATTLHAKWTTTVTVTLEVDDGTSTALTGVTVYLSTSSSDAGSTSANTTSGNVASFSNVTPGTYYIWVTPSGSMTHGSGGSYTGVSIDVTTDRTATVDYYSLNAEATGGTITSPASGNLPQIVLAGRTVSVTAAPDTENGYTGTPTWTLTEGSGDSSLTPASGNNTTTVTVNTKTTVKAEYGLKTYTVTFKNNGKGTLAGVTADVVKTYNHGALLSTLEPAKAGTGLTFAGWTTDATANSGNWVASSTEITEDKTLYAQWYGYEVKDTAADYLKVEWTATTPSTLAETSETVTIRNIGTLPLTLAGTSGATITPSNNTDYFKSATLGDTSPSVATPVTFVAGIKDNVAAPAASEYTTNYVVNVTASDTGNGSGVDFSASTTYQAKLIVSPASNITVTFHKNDGGEDVTTTQTVAYGTDELLKTIATIGWARTGYDFSKWHTQPSGSGGTNYSDGGTVNSPTNINLYAQWTKKKFTISYVKGDGASGGPHNVEDQEFESTYTILSFGDVNTALGDANKLTPPDDSYEFASWLVGSEVKNPGDSFTVTGNTTIKAQWRQPTYTVTYDAGGGSGTHASQTVTATTSDSTNYTFPNTTTFTAPSGQRFKGWKIGDDPHDKGTSIRITADTTVTAVWEDDTHTVTFNVNNSDVAAGNTATFTKTSNKDTKRVDPWPGTPVRAGYSFGGWFDSATDGTEITSTYTFSADKELFAHWTQDVYGLEFRESATGGAVTTGSKSETYGTTPTTKTILVYTTSASNKDLSGLTIEVGGANSADFETVTLTGASLTAGAADSVSFGIKPKSNLAVGNHVVIYTVKDSGNHATATYTYTYTVTAAKLPTPTLEFVSNPTVADASDGKVRVTNLSDYVAGTKLELKRNGTVVNTHTLTSEEITAGSYTWDRNAGTYTVTAIPKDDESNYTDSDASNSVVLTDPESLSATITVNLDGAAWGPTGGSYTMINDAGDQITNAVVELRASDALTGAASEVTVTPGASSWSATGLSAAKTYHIFLAGMDTGLTVSDGDTTGKVVNTWRVQAVVGENADKAETAGKTFSDSPTAAGNTVIVLNGKPAYFSALPDATKAASDATATWSVVKTGSGTSTESGNTFDIASVTTKVVATASYDLATYTGKVETYVNNVKTNIVSVGLMTGNDDGSPVLNSSGAGGEYSFTNLTAGTTYTHAQVKTTSGGKTKTFVVTLPGEGLRYSPSENQTKRIDFQTITMQTKVGEDTGVGGTALAGKAAETPDAASVIAPRGHVLAIKATPANDNFEFDSWGAEPASPAVAAPNSATTTYTVGDTNATLTAVFTAKPVLEVTPETISATQLQGHGAFTITNAAQVKNVGEATTGTLAWVINDSATFSTTNVTTGAAGSLAGWLTVTEANTTALAKNAAHTFSVGLKADTVGGGVLTPGTYTAYIWWYDTETALEESTPTIYDSMAVTVTIYEPIAALPDPDSFYWDTYTRNTYISSPTGNNSQVINVGLWNMVSTGPIPAISMSIGGSTVNLIAGTDYTTGSVTGTGNNTKVAVTLTESGLVKMSDAIVAAGANQGTIKITAVRDKGDSTQELKDCYVTMKLVDTMPTLTSASFDDSTWILGTDLPVLTVNASNGDTPSGTEKLTYQWSVNGVEQDGWTEAVLTDAHKAALQAGQIVKVEVKGKGDPYQWPGDSRPIYAKTPSRSASFTVAAPDVTVVIKVEGDTNEYTSSHDGILAGKAAWGSSQFQVTTSVTPATKYRFSQWTISQTDSVADGTLSGVVSTTTNSSGIFTPTHAAKVTANWLKIGSLEFQKGASASGPNGSTGDDATKYTDSVKNIGAGEATNVTITIDDTSAGVFDIAVDGGNNVTLAAGGTKGFTITPKAAAVPGTTYPITVTATYKERGTDSETKTVTQIVYYTVPVPEYDVVIKKDSHDPIWGKITGSYNGSTKNTETADQTFSVSEGGYVSLTATPATGYKFVSWSQTATPGSATENVFDSTAAASALYGQVKKATEISATFKAVTDLTLSPTTSSKEANVGYTPADAAHTFTLANNGALAGDATIALEGANFTLKVDGSDFTSGSSQAVAKSGDDSASHTITVTPAADLPAGTYVATLTVTETTAADDTMSGQKSWTVPITFTVGGFDKATVQVRLDDAFCDNEIVVLKKDSNQFVMTAPTAGHKYTVSGLKLNTTYAVWVNGLNTGLTVATPAASNGEAVNQLAQFYTVELAVSPADKGLTLPTATGPKAAALTPSVTAKTGYLSGSNVTVTAIGTQTGSDSKTYKFTAWSGGSTATTASVTITGINEAKVGEKSYTANYSTVFGIKYWPNVTGEETDPFFVDSAGYTLSTSSISLLAAGPTRAGYTFAGWGLANSTAASAKLSNTVTPTDEPSAGLGLAAAPGDGYVNLFAIWTKETPTWPTLADGTYGVAYTGSVAPTGGFTATGVTYSVSGGALPGGLRLDASTGALSGKPYVVGNDQTFAVTATKGTDTWTHEFTIDVDKYTPVLTASASGAAKDAAYSTATYTGTVTAPKLTETGETDTWVDVVFTDQTLTTTDSSNGYITIASGTFTTGSNTVGLTWKPGTIGTDAKPTTANKYNEIYNDATANVLVNISGGTYGLTVNPQTILWTVKKGYTVGAYEAGHDGTVENNKAYGKQLALTSTGDDVGTVTFPALDAAHFAYGGGSAPTVTTLSSGDSAVNFSIQPVAGLDVGTYYQNGLAITGANGGSTMIYNIMLIVEEADTFAFEVDTFQNFFNGSGVGTRTKFDVTSVQLVPVGGGDAVGGYHNATGEYVFNADHTNLLDATKNYYVYINGDGSTGIQVPGVTVNKSSTSPLEVDFYQLIAEKDSTDHTENDPTKNPDRTYFLAGEPVTVTAGSPKSGFQFKSWTRTLENGEPDLATTNYNTNDSMTYIMTAKATKLTAVYEATATKYKVVLNTNKPGSVEPTLTYHTGESHKNVLTGGEISGDDYLVVKDATFGLPMPVLASPAAGNYAISLSGYTFKGWATANDATVGGYSFTAGESIATDINADEVKDTITLYAVWEKNSDLDFQNAIIEGTYGHTIAVADDGTTSNATFTGGVVSGGTPPYTTFTVADGSTIPAALSLITGDTTNTAKNGKVSGRPNVVGTSTANITVSNSGATKTATYTFIIAKADVQPASTLPPVSLDLASGTPDASALITAFGTPQMNGVGTNETSISGTWSVEGDVPTAPGTYDVPMKFTPANDSGAAEALRKLDGNHYNPYNTTVKVTVEAKKIVFAGLDVTVPEAGQVPMTTAQLRDKGDAPTDNPANKLRDADNKTNASGSGGPTYTTDVEIYNVSWTPDDPNFQSGKDYTVRVTLKIKDDSTYAFDTGDGAFSGTIAERPATVETVSSDYAVLVYTFPKECTIIDVSTGTPVVGNTSNAVSVPTLHQGEYTIESYHWVQNGGEDSGKTVGTGEGQIPFKNGEKYDLIVTVKKKAGVEFANGIKTAAADNTDHSNSSDAENYFATVNTGKPTDGDKVSNVHTAYNDGDGTITIVYKSFVPSNKRIVGLRVEGVPGDYYAQTEADSKHYVGTNATTGNKTDVGFAFQKTNLTVYTVDEDGNESVITSGFTVKRVLGDVAVPDSFKDGYDGRTDVAGWNGKTLYVVLDSNPSVKASVPGFLTVTKLEADTAGITVDKAPKLTYNASGSEKFAVDAGSGAGVATVTFNTGTPVANSNNGTTLAYTAWNGTANTYENQSAATEDMRTKYFYVMDNDGDGVIEDGETELINGTTDMTTAMHNKDVYACYVDVNGKLIYKKVGTLSIAGVPTVTVTDENVHDAEYGDTLTATPSGGSGGYTYQWEISTDGGSTWTPISGATGAIYVPGKGDIDKKVRVTVTDSNGTPATSEPLTIYKRSLNFTVNQQDKSYDGDALNKHSYTAADFTPIQVTDGDGTFGGAFPADGVTIAPAGTWNSADSTRPPYAAATVGSKITWPEVVDVAAEGKHTPADYTLGDNAAYYRLRPQAAQDDRGTIVNQGQVTHVDVSYTTDDRMPTFGGDAKNPNKVTQLGETVPGSYTSGSVYDVTFTGTWYKRGDGFDVKTAHGDAVTSFATAGEYTVVVPVKPAPGFSYDPATSATSGGTHFWFHVGVGNQSDVEVFVNSSNTGTSKQGVYEDGGVYYMWYTFTVAENTLKNIVRVGAWVDAPTSDGALNPSVFNTLAQNVSNDDLREHVTVSDATWYKSATNAYDSTDALSGAGLNVVDGSFYHATFTVSVKDASKLAGYTFQAADSNNNGVQNAAETYLALLVNGVTTDGAIATATGSNWINGANNGSNTASTISNWVTYNGTQVAVQPTSDNADGYQSYKVTVRFPLVGGTADILTVLADVKLPEDGNTPAPNTDMTVRTDQPYVITTDTHAVLKWEHKDGSDYYTTDGKLNGTGSAVTGKDWGTFAAGQTYKATLRVNLRDEYKLTRQFWAGVGLTVGSATINATQGYINYSTENLSSPATVVKYYDASGNQIAAGTPGAHPVYVELAREFTVPDATVIKPAGLVSFSGLQTVYYAETNKHDVIDDLANNQHNDGSGSPDAASVPGGKQGIGFTVDRLGVTGTIVYDDGTTTKTLKPATTGSSPSTELYYGANWRLYVVKPGTSDKLYLDTGSTTYAAKEFTDANRKQADIYAAIGNNNSYGYGANDYNGVNGIGAGNTVYLEVTDGGATKTFEVGKLEVKQLWVQGLTYTGSVTLSYPTGGNFTVSNPFTVTAHFNTDSLSYNVSYVVPDEASSLSTLALGSTDATKYYFVTVDSGNNEAHLKTGDSLTVADNGKTLYLGYTDINEHDYRVKLGTLAVGSDDSTAVIQIHNQTQGVAKNQETEYGDVLQAVVYGGSGGTYKYQWQRADWNATSNKYEWTNVGGETTSDLYTTTKNDVGKFFRVKLVQDGTKTIPAAGIASEPDAIADTMGTADYNATLRKRNDADQAAREAGTYTHVATTATSNHIYVGKKIVEVYYKWTPGERAWNGSAVVTSTASEFVPYDDAAFTTLYSDGVNQKVAGSSDVLTLTAITANTSVFRDAGDTADDPSVGTDKPIKLTGGTEFSTAATKDYYILKVTRPKGDVTQLEIDPDTYFKFVLGTVKRYDSTTRVFSVDNTANDDNENHGTVIAGAQSLAGITVTSNTDPIQWASIAGLTTDQLNEIKNNLTATFAYDSQHVSATKVIITLNPGSGNIKLTKTTVEKAARINPKQVNVTHADLDTPINTLQDVPAVTLTGKITDVRARSAINESDRLEIGSDNPVNFTMGGLFNNGAHNPGAETVNVLGATISWDNPDYLLTYTGNPTVPGEVLPPNITGITAVGGSGTYGDTFDNSGSSNVTTTNITVTVTVAGSATPVTITGLASIKLAGLKVELTDPTPVKDLTDAANAGATIPWKDSQTLKLKVTKVADATVNREGDFTVAKRPLTVTPTWNLDGAGKQGKYYDGTTLAATEGASDGLWDATSTNYDNHDGELTFDFDTTELAPGDATTDLSVTAYTGSFVTPDVEYTGATVIKKPIKVTGTTLGGTKGVRYTIQTMNDATGYIQPRPVTIDFTEPSIYVNGTMTNIPIYGKLVEKDGTTALLGGAVTVSVSDFGDFDQNTKVVTANDTDPVSDVTPTTGNGGTGNDNVTVKATNKTTYDNNNKNYKITWPAKINGNVLPLTTQSAVHAIVKKPVAGDPISAGDIKIPSGVDYMITTGPNANRKWLHKTDDSSGNHPGDPGYTETWEDATGTFVAGETYKAVVRVNVQAGKTLQFTSGTAGYVDSGAGYVEATGSSSNPGKEYLDGSGASTSDPYPTYIELSKEFNVAPQKIIVEVKSKVPTAGASADTVNATIDKLNLPDHWSFVTDGATGTSPKGWFTTYTGDPTTAMAGGNFADDTTYFLVVTVKPDTNYALDTATASYKWYNADNSAYKSDALVGSVTRLKKNASGEYVVDASGDVYRVAFQVDLGTAATPAKDPMVEIVLKDGTTGLPTNELGIQLGKKVSDYIATSSNDTVSIRKTKAAPTDPWSNWAVAADTQDVEWYEGTWPTGTPMAATATFDIADPGTTQNVTKYYTVKIHVSDAVKSGGRATPYLDGEGLIFNRESNLGTIRPADPTNPVTTENAAEKDMFKAWTDEAGELYVIHTFKLTKSFVHTTDPNPGGGGGGGGGTTEVKLPVVYYKLRDLGVTNDLTAEKMTKVSGDKPKNVPKVTPLEDLKFLGWSETDPDTVKDPSKITLVDPTTVTIKKDDKIFYAVYEKVTGEVKTGFDHTHYVIGFPDGTFAPDANITRGQVATIVARSCLEGFVEGSDYGNPGNYSDVTEHWAYSAISYCYMHGAMNGYEDGTFRPDRYITRQELSNVVARLAGMQTGTVTEFTDADQIAAWAMNGVYTMVSKGWVNGYKEDDGTYTIRPERNITRAETVKIFNRLLNRGTDQEGLKDMTQYVHTGVASNNTENEYTEYMVWPDVVGHWAYYEIIEAANDHDFHGRDTDEKVPPEDWTRVHIDEKWRYYDNADDGADDVGRSLPRLTVTYVVKSNGVVHSSVTETVVKFESPKPENLPTARANEGYRFVGWSKVDPESPTFNQATDLVDPTANYVAEDTIFYAVFQPN